MSALPPPFVPGAASVSGTFRRPLPEVCIDDVHSSLRGDRVCIKALVGGVLPSQLHAAFLSVDQTSYNRGMLHFSLTAWTADPGPGHWWDPRQRLETESFERVVEIYRGSLAGMGTRHIGIHLYNDSTEVSLKHFNVPEADCD